MSPRLNELFTTNQSNPDGTNAPLASRPTDLGPLARENSEAITALLAGLNAAQAEAVLADTAILRIIAGAGSGKTRVLTRRIGRRVLQGEIDPRRALAITFTRKSAAELRSRLGQMGLRGGVNAGTFHSVAFTQLRLRWQERGVQPPTLIDRKFRYIARLLPNKKSTTVFDVISEIEWAKARMISATDYPSQANAALREPPLPAEQIAAVFEKYETMKLKSRLVDFDDLLRLATRDMQSDAEFAAARQWRFRHLFVDEFQDVNPLQFRLLQQWVGPRADLCVVGDPNQAIYAWNGADSRYLNDFAEHFPGGQTIELSDNYRSSPQILGIANTVLSQGPAAKFDLVPNRPDGPIPIVTEYQDEATEARSIARKIRDSHAPGSRWADAAVLVRTNAQIPVLEEAFVRAKIPVRARGASSLLEQPEVKDALSTMRRGGSLPVHLADLQAQLGLSEDGVPVEGTLGSLPERGGSALEGGSAEEQMSEERLANLAELVRMGREFLDLSPEGNVFDFAEWVRSALRNEGGDPSSDAVELSTFHAAKGLEWPQVFIAGLESGLVPISHAKTAEAEAEELRLLYVAITRAERTLHLSWARQRTFGVKAITRRPSPHFEAINLAIELLQDATAPSDLGAAIQSRQAALTAQLATPNPSRAKSRRRERLDAVAAMSAEDRELLDHLKRWRRDRARAAGTPAFVIFDDSVLTHISEARPTSRRALLAIKGIGEVKVERFGNEILEMVAQHSTDIST